MVVVVGIYCDVDSKNRIFVCTDQNPFRSSRNGLEHEDLTMYSISDPEGS